MERKWDLRFLNLCKEVSTWSKDRSTKTGCVIVRPDRSIASTGYNGFPRGVAETDERLDKRPDKYFYTEHCDRNAIFTASKHSVSLEGCTMYLTGVPCADCARAIIQSGIVEVVYDAESPFNFREDWKDNTDAALAMLEEAGVYVKPVYMEEE